MYRRACIIIQLVFFDHVVNLRGAFFKFECLLLDELVRFVVDLLGDDLVGALVFVE